MVQSLIEQLQFGALDGTTPITDLLRKAKLAAVKLSTSDFATWVDLEMAGYMGQPSVPSYRRIRGSLKFLNPYHGWCPIVGLDNLEKDVVQPVGELMTLSVLESGFLTIGVPESIRKSVWQNVGFNCDVQLHVGTVAVAGIVEAVRNNILEWTLKLEQAGIHGHGLTFTPEEARAAQNMMVTNNYHGPVASVAQGSNVIGSVSQTNASATPQDIAEAIARLVQALPTGQPLGPETNSAISDLANSEMELRAGRIPMGRISKAFGLLGKAEDLAIRAPEAAARLRELGQILGLL